jgi:hypothetical protein
VGRFLQEFFWTPVETSSWLRRTISVLGTSEIIPAPVWRQAGGQRLLDFQKSYAVQVAPPIMVVEKKILLQGQMAIFPRRQYEDSKKADRLIALFRHLRTDLVERSDRSHVVIQTTSSGTIKRWKDILLGRQVSNSGLLLKQFVKGEVFFEIGRTLEAREQ